MLFLLVATAWGSLFVPLPRWASVICSVFVLGIGVLMTLFGLAAAYWNDHMAPSDSGGTAVWVSGVLMLLSRAGLVIRIVLEALAAPNSP